ncbi:hypothetical protein AB6A40_005714 [Gnathostoma spinigerum]|uniref:Protein kinase domain-containing protein n=1 Tax=Gnathostoma spinigerum TaxID=75299 RepID=A0ABD6ERW7_9BILA
MLENSMSTAEAPQQSNEPKKTFVVYSDENNPPSPLIEDMMIEPAENNPKSNVDAGDTGFKKPAWNRMTEKRSIFGRSNTLYSGGHEEIQRYKGMTFPTGEDEETIAGLHKLKKGGNMVAITSTPADAFAPPIQDPLEDTLFRPATSSAADVMFPVSGNEEEAVVKMTVDGERRQSFAQASKWAPSAAALAQKLGLENTSKKGKNEAIENAVGRLCLGSDEKFDEPTGKGLRSTVNVETNPWDQATRESIMMRSRIVPPYSHDFPEKTGRPVPGKSTFYGGERFDIQALIGEGGFAKVYKARSEDGKVYAIKFEIPACRWEVYICELLRLQLPPRMHPCIMSICDAYIFANASAIVFEYHGLGNLLDLVNEMKKKRSFCSGMLTVYLGLHMARILEVVHAAKIIHGDVKPDNFMILSRYPWSH